MHAVGIKSEELRIVPGSILTMIMKISLIPSPIKTDPIFISLRALLFTRNRFIGSQYVCTCIFKKPLKVNVYDGILFQFCGKIFKLKEVFW